MKKVKLFMALALLAFFGLFSYSNYVNPGPGNESNTPVEMTEIKSDLETPFVNNLMPMAKPDATILNKSVDDAAMTADRK